MKISSIFFTVSIFCILSANAQLKGDRYADALRTKKAKIVYTYANSPGFLKAETNGISGICADIMTHFEKYVKEKKGIQLEVQYQAKDPNNFTMFLEEVKKSSGGVFGLSSTTITAQRSKMYAFSPPYINNIKLILTHKNVATLQKIGDISKTFSALTAVTVKNSTNEQRLQKIKKVYFPEMKIVYERSSNDVIKRVLSDPKTFTSLDCTYYFPAMRENKPVKKHPVNDVNAEHFGIIMPKNNDWAPILAEFMKGFVGSMPYKKIIANNLGSTALGFFGMAEK